MIDPAPKWESTFDKLEKVSTPIWAKSMAEWYAERIQSIQPDPKVFTAVGFTFTFNPAPLAAALAGLAPGPAPAAAALIADAWFSSFATVLFPVGISVGPGSSYGSPSPATTYSSIISVLISPIGLAAGKLKIISSLSAMTPSKEAKSSKIPKALNEATLQLKMDVTGLNTLAPTPAPLPAIGVPLI